MKKLKLTAIPAIIVKKIMKTSILCLVVLITGITACERISPENEQFTDPIKVSEMITNGSWIISSMIDSGKDETHHFSGYNFYFGSNGILTATNGQKSYQATWSITSGKSGDDGSDDLDFNIFFDASGDWEELNDDWDILSQSDNKIELIDVSGGNGGTDFLTFSKKT